MDLPLVSGAPWLGFRSRPRSVDLFQGATTALEVAPGRGLQAVATALPDLWDCRCLENFLVTPGSNLAVPGRL